jgi:transcriptional regulator with XRE-family HTH domain
MPSNAEGVGTSWHKRLRSCLVLGGTQGRLLAESEKSMPATKISTQLRSIRQSSGKTQAEVAGHLNVSRSTVVQMEHGNRRVTAEDIDRLARLYQCSPSVLLSGQQPEATDRGGDALVDLVQAFPAIRDDVEEFKEIEQVVTIARTLTDFERRLGLDTCSLGPHAYYVGSPSTAWEAMRQGFLAASEERRRLNLGDAPIRDVDQTLAVNRIRMTKIKLSMDVACIFLNSEETGFLVIVNGHLPIEARRFHYAHGYGHLLFDSGHRSFVCSAGCRQDFVEVRASAFANSFLLPESGLRRYLESLGKDVLGRTRGVEMDLFCERNEQGRETTDVPVTGRNRRGAEPINVCDLTQIASFFGVSRSLVVSRLRNLRYVTADQFEALDELNSRGVATAAHDALALTHGHVESEGDAFRSRLVALAVTGVDRGLWDKDEVSEITELVGLPPSQREALLALAVTTLNKKNRSRKDEYEKD